jgi:hypothetical protein
MEIEAFAGQHDLRDEEDAEWLERLEPCPEA